MSINITSQILATSSSHGQHRVVVPGGCPSRPCQEGHGKNCLRLGTKAVDRFNDQKEEELFIDIWYHLILGSLFLQ